MTFCHWPGAGDAYAAWMSFRDQVSEIRQTFCISAASPLHSVLWSHGTTFHLPVALCLAYPLLLMSNLYLEHSFLGFSLANTFSPFRFLLTFHFLWVPGLGKTVLLSGQLMGLCESPFIAFTTFLAWIWDLSASYSLKTGLCLSSGLIDDAVLSPAITQSMLH